MFIVGTQLGEHVRCAEARIIIVSQALMPADVAYGTECDAANFSLTVTYKSRTGLITLPLPTPTPPDKRAGPDAELARTNWALASNEGKASAPSTLSSSLESYLNDGDRTGAGGKVWADNTINVFPDYVIIQLKRKRRIDEIDVYTRREDLTTPGDPTMSEEFSSYGITSYEVQYWDGSAWMTVPGGFAGRGKFAPSPNKKVWRQFTGFKVTTDQIRILIHGAQDNNYSRVVEVEAWGT